MLYAMAATTLAGLATALGGALGAIRRPGRQGMAFAMGFGAGVMLAVSLMDMLPGALGRYLAAFAPLRAGAMAASLVLLGLAAGWLLERVLPEEAAFSAGGEEGRVLRSALVTALALVGHNLPEGAMTLFASLDDPAVGLRLAVAIGLHNLPEGLAVALPVLSCWMAVAGRHWGYWPAFSFSSTVAAPAFQPPISSCTSACTLPSPSASDSAVMAACPLRLPCFTVTWVPTAASLAASLSSAKVSVQPVSASASRPATAVLFCPAARSMRVSVPAFGAVSTPPACCSASRACSSALAASSWARVTAAWAWLAAVASAASRAARS